MAQSHTNPYTPTMTTPHKHKPTKALRDAVRTAATYGVPVRYIAAMISAARRGPPISDVVLMNHYHRELDEGRSAGVTAVGKAMFERATGAGGQPVSVDAAKWWLSVVAKMQPAPQQLEVGRAGEFASLEDSELDARIADMSRVIDVEP